MVRLIAREQLVQLLCDGVIVVPLCRSLLQDSAGMAHVPVVAMQLQFGELAVAQVLQIDLR